MTPSSQSHPHRQTPLLCLLGLRAEDDPVPFALALLESARAEGVDVSVCTVGAELRRHPEESHARLSAASGHAVHRIDVDLMPVPSIQRVAERAGAGADFVLVVAFEAAVGEGLRLPGYVDVQRALGAPVVICTEGARSATSAVQAALDFFTDHGVDRTPMVCLAGADESSRAAVRTATGLEVVPMAPPSDQGDRWRLKGAELDRLVEHAKSVPAGAPAAATSAEPSSASPQRRHRGERACIGVVMDECFDLYDEESLLQFELAGAELVPLSAMAGGRDRAESITELIGELDGVIIGDGHIERHSATLSTNHHFRAELKRAIESGLPTLASGSGFAYLTRGLRTITGALHPMLGVIDAEAVVLQSRPAFGHVEVETLVDTLVGAPGQRLRGFVQRNWLVRGLAPDERGIYTTISGPRDEGCGRAELFATHFRPYWPSCPSAADSFIDRCVRSAVARERIRREGAAELELSDDATR